MCRLICSIVAVNGIDATITLIGFIYYGGGILLAAICFWNAARKMKSRDPGTWVLLGIGVLFLLIQAGCWVVAKGMRGVQ